jgi:hypothetical protein
MNFEAFHNYEEKIGWHYEGWFMPPITANYRFYMSCDDHCILDLAHLPNNVTNSTRLLEITKWTHLRDYFTPPFNSAGISQWVPLTAGEPYYIEAKYKENGGGDHFTVAVEIEQDEVQDHH